MSWGEFLGELTEDEVQSISFRDLPPREVERAIEHLHSAPDAWKSLPNLNDVCDGDTFVPLLRIPDCDRLLLGWGNCGRELAVLTLDGHVDRELTDAARREFYGWLEISTASLRTLAEFIRRRRSKA